MPQFANPNKTAPEGATPRKIIRSAEEAWEARQETLRKEGGKVSPKESPARTMDDLKNRGPNELGLHRALSEEETKRLYEKMVAQQEEDDARKAKGEIDAIKNLPAKKLSLPPSSESSTPKNTQEKPSHQDQIRQQPLQSKEGFFKRIASLFKKNANPEKISIDADEKKMPENAAKPETTPIEMREEKSRPEENRPNETVENASQEKESALSNEVLERIEYFSGKLKEREKIIESLANGTSITMENGEEFPASSRKEFMGELLRRREATKLFSEMEKKNPHWIELSGMLNTVYELIADGYIVGRSNDLEKALALSVSKTLSDKQKQELARKLMEEESPEGLAKFQGVLKSFDFANKRTITEEYVRTYVLYQEGKKYLPGDPFTKDDREFVNRIIQYLNG